jgi:O-antigen/teichoic acid export membrane protein
MGVIQRQSIKQSIINYLAVGIAAISTIFIYPLDKDTYGLARFVIDTAQMAAPFILMGFSGVSIRFFPQFKDEEKGHRGFLFFLVLSVSIGSVVFIFLALLFKDQFYGMFEEKPPIYRQFLPYLVPLAIITAFLQLFVNYSSNFHRIAIPAVFPNLIKVGLPILILLFIWQMIAIEQVVDGIMITFTLALIGSVGYLFWLRQLKLKPDFSLLTKKRLKAIRAFAVFSLFSSVGSVLAFRIDSFMVTKILDFQSNGAYNISLFIANVIAIPTVAVAQISGPIITTSIQENNFEHVKKLYQGTSINLLVVGLLLFIGIMASIADLFSLMPKSEEMQGGVMIVFLIGLAKLIDMGTSINNQIISYSKYYRFGFYSILLMAAFNIFANLILIPRFQIVGAAAATLASLTLYNLVKLVFIQWRFNMQPFSWKTLWLLAIAGAVYLLGVLIPSTGSALLDILVKSTVIGGAYIGAVVYLNISLEFNDLIFGMIEKLKGLLKIGK